MIQNIRILWREGMGAPIWYAIFAYVFVAAMRSASPGFSFVMLRRGGSQVRQEDRALRNGPGKYRPALTGRAMLGAAHDYLGTATEVLEAGWMVFLADDSCSDSLAAEARANLHAWSSGLAPFPGGSARSPLCQVVGPIAPASSRGIG